VYYCFVDNLINDWNYNDIWTVLNFLLQFMNDDEKNNFINKINKQKTKTN
jgi:hypothetical protein